MNVERLHLIALAVRDEINNSGFENLVQQLVTALQNAVNQPQTPTFQQQIAQLRGEIIVALDKSQSNEYGSTWRLVLDDIGATPFLGKALRESMESIFDRNQITPAVALQEVQQLSSDFTALKSAIDQLISALKLMKIGAEELEPGECEIDVLIPRDFVGNRLDKLADELHELNEIFGTFAEVTTGGRDGFQIKALASSELMVFIHAHIDVAAMIAKAVCAIIIAYKNILDIKKSHRELEEKGVPKESLEGIEQYANGKMKEEVRRLAQELIQEYKGEQGRKNELEISLRFAGNKIANRIDRGFNIEVRVSPLEQQSSEPTALEDNSAYSAIVGSSKDLQFIKVGGRLFFNFQNQPRKRRMSRGLGT